MVHVRRCHDGQQSVYSVHAADVRAAAGARLSIAPVELSAGHFFQIHNVLEAAVAVHRRGILITGFSLNVDLHIQAYSACLHAVGRRDPVRSPVGLLQDDTQIHAFKRVVVVYALFQSIGKADLHILGCCKPGGYQLLCFCIKAMFALIAAIAAAGRRPGVFIRISEYHREPVFAAIRTRQVKQVVDVIFLDLRHGQLVNVLVRLVRVVGRVQREYLRIPLNVIRQRGRTVPKSILIYRQKAVTFRVCTHADERRRGIVRPHIAAALQQSSAHFSCEIDRASAHLYGRQRERVVPRRPHSRGQQTQRHGQCQQQARHLFHTRFLLISVSLMDTCFRRA